MVAKIENDSIEKLIQINQKLLFVMGHTVSLIMEIKKDISEDKKEDIDCVIKAIENIVYLNKPLPPMP